MALSLSEQYKHPLWEIKSKEIKLRDGDACVICDDSLHRLDVHHICYLPDLLLWEYDNELMITVCRKCHDKLNLELPKLAGLIALKILTSHIDVTNIDNLINILQNHGTNKNNKTGFFQKP